MARRLRGVVFGACDDHFQSPESTRWASLLHLTCGRGMRGQSVGMDAGEMTLITSEGDGFSGSAGATNISMLVLEPEQKWARCVEVR